MLCHGEAKAPSDPLVCALRVCVTAFRPVAARGEVEESRGSSRRKGCAMVELQASEYRSGRVAASIPDSRYLAALAEPDLKRYTTRLHTSYRYGCIRSNTSRSFEAMC
jgi:hypothetical protein